MELSKSSLLESCNSKIESSAARMETRALPYNECPCSTHFSPSNPFLNFPPSVCPCRSDGVTVTFPAEYLTCPSTALAGTIYPILSSNPMSSFPLPWVRYMYWLHFNMYYSTAPSGVGWIHQCRTPDIEGQLWSHRGFQACVLQGSTVYIKSLAHSGTLVIITIIEIRQTSI